MNLLHKVAKENRIIFTTPYFQILAGQEVKKIERETITREELEDIYLGKSKYNQSRNIVFCARDKNGQLNGMCYINQEGDIIKNKLFDS